MYLKFNLTSERSERMEGVIPMYVGSPPPGVIKSSLMRKCYSGSVPL